MHGRTDDNVYFQHTMELADALFMAGKPYEMLPMTGTHMAGAENPLVNYREELRAIDFFNQHLMGPE